MVRKMISKANAEEERLANEWLKKANKTRSQADADAYMRTRNKIMERVYVWREVLGIS